MTGVQLHDPARHLRDIEHRNAVPWEALFAGLDRAGTPGARQRTLTQPGISGEVPALTPPGTAPVQRSLSRTRPVVPVPGTVGRPVFSSRRTLH